MAYRSDHRYDIDVKRATSREGGCHSITGNGTATFQKILEQTIGSTRALGLGAGRYIHIAVRWTTLEAGDLEESLRVWVYY